MDLETPIEGGFDAASDVELFADLRQEPEPETTEPAAEPTEAVQPVAESTDEPSELELLKRTVAMDPVLRQAYMAQKYGGPMPQAPQYQAQPQQAQQPEQPQTGSLQELFGEEGFDPYNVQHQLTLQQVALQQQLQPFQQWLQQEQSAQAQLAQQQAMQQFNDLDNKVQDMVEQYIPGYKAVAGKQQATFEEKTLLHAAETEFQRILTTEYPQDFWLNPNVHREIVGRLAPQLKQLATRLGVVQPQAKRGVDPTLVRESYVEPSNATPSDNPNALRHAIDTGNDVAAFLALRQS